ncbi:MAG: twin-arginine translocase subunit TatB [Acidobacteria bacterium]|nr:MAG: twin-arginine translocase subunit TatB [Acidobacteriota bacterium]
MGQLGFSEMLVIFIVALLVFGPKKLPELGKSLGKGIREFRKATDELKSTWEEQVKDIQAPLNDVKRDMHEMGQDLKTDFYKSVEAEHSNTASHETHGSSDIAQPTESTVPKEHV